MTPSELARPTAVLPDEIAALEPIERVRRRWPALLAGALSLAMVVGLAAELLDDGLAGLEATAPDHPGFYLALALVYLAPPGFDWWIFRRLWGLPPEGLVALNHKRIANEVVVGYSGDAYFYAWARARLKFVAAPFGAVKDVTILSGIAGNVVTLAMLVVAVPMMRALLSDEQLRLLLGSAGVTLVLTLPWLIFSRRVFSLPRPTLWWVFNVHCLRLLFGSTMIALAWHLALPHVSIGMWLFLAAARLLVSRLPLVPNKELLFASLAILVIGEDTALAELVAFTAALTLLAHVTLIAGFAAWAVARRVRA